MDISHLCTAYQHFNLSDTSSLYFDAGISYFGFQKSKCRESIVTAVNG